MNEEQYENLGALILLIAILIILTTLLIFAFFAENKKIKQVKEFKKTLNQDQKALIHDYEESQKIFFKKKQKNESQQN